MEEKKRINFHQIIWYFLLFSIAGLLIETVFCYVTTGVIESRKGLVWGPFCPVYGIGATILILLLDRYKDSYIKLFVYGSILGNIIEYILSYLLEAVYGTRFWDYAFIQSNLNGRICIKYSLFWGALAIILIKVIKPWVDRVINKIPTSKRILINSVILILFIVDALATIWGIKVYQTRVVEQYYKIESVKTNEAVKAIQDKLFSNAFMLKTFPNLRYIDNKGTQYYIRDIIKADQN